MDSTAEARDAAAQAAADYRSHRSTGYTSQSLFTADGRLIGAVQGGRTSLHDVADVEALAREAMESRLQSWSAHLHGAEREDALSFLVGTAYVLAQGFNPDLGLSFSTYLYRMLRLRLADWYRARFRDARHGPTSANDTSLDAMHESRVPFGDVADPELIEEQIISLVNARMLKGKPSCIRTLLLVAIPMARDDETVADAARRLGRKRREVAFYLDELRREMYEIHEFAA